MTNMLLHTPEGVRDIYGKECSRKLDAERAVSDVFRLYGYHDIQTPTFEYFDTFSKERGSVPSKDLYKFFDREGNTLVLRPDITPSIARSIAQYDRDDDVPVRLCYNANVYINHSELQGKLKENTQLGCELIGDASVDADAEMIALIVDALKKSGLKEFLVEVGNAGFLEGLSDECGLSADENLRLRTLIENKNYFGVEEFLGTLDIPSSKTEAFIRLPELFGQAEVLSLARTLTDNERALRSLDRLQDLYGLLKEYGVTKYISFDLGLLSSYSYYTGMIFKAYTYGTGDAIVSGGRYDGMLKQFGKDAAAVGFGIHMDRLLLAMSGQDDSKNSNDAFEVVLYEPDKQKEALSMATSLRRAGIRTELIRKSPEIDVEEYSRSKTALGAVKVTYLK